MFVEGGHTDTSPVVFLKNERPWLVEQKPLATDGLDPTVVIGKDARYPNHFITGPSKMAKIYYNAFELLDYINRPSRAHREMCVMVKGRYIRDQDGLSISAKLPDGYALTPNLINEIVTEEHINNSKYRNWLYNKDTTSFGAITDTNPPIFAAPDTTYIYDTDKYEPAMTYFAVRMLSEEWTHINQYRQGFPTNTMIAERHAISESCRLIEWFILHNISKIDKDNEELVISHLKYYQEIIESYRKQTMHKGHGHISNSYWQPDPKKYPLHDPKMDYRFH